jgi:hypothetical protein
MPQLLPDPPFDKGTSVDPETARIVLRLDHAISAFRAGQASGVPSLDSALGLQDDTDVSKRWPGVDSGRSPRVPRRPDRVELTILRALADTYGAELLTNASLGYALRLVARHGGVTFVQRVLWGESATDVQLSVMLTAARAAFTQVTLAFTKVFLAEANDLIAGFQPRRPGAPAPGPEGADE